MRHPPSPRMCVTSQEAHRSYRCPESFLGCRYVGMIDWTAGHRTELRRSPPRSLWKSDWVLGLEAPALCIAWLVFLVRQAPVLSHLVSLGYMGTRCESSHHWKLSGPWVNNRAAPVPGEIPRIWRLYDCIVACHWCQLINRFFFLHSTVSVMSRFWKEYCMISGEVTTSSWWVSSWVGG